LNDAARHSVVFASQAAEHDENLEEGGSAGVEAADNIAAKAGIILGIHNVFIVLPQFLSTAMAAVVFAIFEPAREVITKPHPAPGHSPVAPSPTPTLLFHRVEDPGDSSPDALGVVFRIGGLSSFIAFLLAWRLSRTLRRLHR